MVIIGTTFLTFFLLTTGPGNNDQNMKLHNIIKIPPPRKSWAKPESTTECRTLRFIKTGHKWTAGKDFFDILSLLCSMESPKFTDGRTCDELPIQYWKHKLWESKVGKNAHQRLADICINRQQKQAVKQAGKQTGLQVD